MTQRRSGKDLNFEALRLAIEWCDPDLVLGFYAEDASLSIANAGFPQSSPFELRGRAEIAKHLRAVLGQETSHRVEREIVGEQKVTFREACEYPDGSRVVVETTLEVHGGKIVRQMDLVAKDSQADRREEAGQSPPTRNLHPELHPGVDAPPPDRLLRSKQTSEKEDPR
jgi:SnoaL-like protein